MKHANSASYFASEAQKGVNTLYYTPDGLHFKRQESADAHAKNLKKANKPCDVQAVTREECAEEPSGDSGSGTAPVVLTPKQKGDITKAVNALNKAKEALAATDINDAAALEAAQIAVSTATGALVALPGGAEALAAIPA